MIYSVLILLLIAVDVIDAKVSITLTYYVWYDILCIYMNIIYYSDAADC